MNDQRKTKRQLIAELQQLRSHLHALTRTTEQTLQKQTHLLHEAQAIARIGSWEYDIASDSPTWTPEMFAIFDIDHDKTEPDWLSHQERVHPDDWNGLNQKVQEAIRDNSLYQHEFRIVRRDGSITWARAIGHVHTDENNTAMTLTGTVQDITEQKLVTDALKKSEAYYRSLFDNSMLGILQTQPDGYIIHANDTCVRMFGYATIDDMRAHVKEIATSVYANPEERDEILRLLDTQGYLPPRECLVRKKDGALFTILVSARIIRDEEENPYCYQAEMIDITPMKEAERSLVITNKHFLKAQRIGRIGNWVWNFDDNSLVWSDELYRIFGIEQGFDLSFENIESLILPDDRPYNTLILRNIFNGVSDCVSYELRIRQPAGEIKYLEQNIEVTGDETTGTIIYGTIQDITPRKHAEITLRKNRENLRAIIENTRASIWSIDRSYKLITGNSAFHANVASILGEPIPPGGSVLADVFPPDVRHNWQSLYDRALAGEQFVLECERPFAHEYQVIEYSFNPIVAEDGSVSGVTVFGRDITCQKSAEQSLSDREQILNETGRMARIGGWEHDMTTGEAVWTKALYDIIEIDPREKPPGVKEHLDYYPSESRSILNAAYTRLLEEETPFDLELTAYTRTKKRLWCRVYGEPVCEHGDIVKVRGTFQDISARKQAELALQESEERHRLLFENASMGIGYYTCDGRIIAYNHAAAAHLNGSPEDFAGQSLIELFGPEHGATYQHRLDQATAQPNTMSYEDLASLPTGDKWFISVYNRITDASGAIIGVQIISNDITERKRAELALRNISNILDENPYPVMRLTDSGDILYANKSGSRLLSTMISASTKRIKRTWLSCIRSVIENNTIEQREIQTGKSVYLLSFVPFEDQSYINVYGSDITQLKQAQQELKTVASSIQDAREKERLGIARELHDEIGQLLTGIKMDIAQCRHVIPGYDDRIDMHIKSLQGMTDQAIESVRRMSSDLRPTILDDFGLVVAIEWYLEQFQKRSGITCRAILPEQEPVIDERLSVALYRIVQEALTNVARHAEASIVNIVFTVTDNNMGITIEDDGQGIGEPAIHDSKSLGIMGIRERVNEFEGSFEIIGTPGKGTRIAISIPFRKHDTKHTG